MTSEQQANKLVVLVKLVSDQLLSKTWPTYSSVSSNRVFAWVFISAFNFLYCCSYLQCNACGWEGQIHLANQSQQLKNIWHQCIACWGLGTYKGKGQGWQGEEGKGIINYMETSWVGIKTSPPGKILSDITSKIYCTVSSNADDSLWSGLPAACNDCSLSTLYSTSFLQIRVWCALGNTLITRVRQWKKVKLPEASALTDVVIRWSMLNPYYKNQLKLNLESN